MPKKKIETQPEVEDTEQEAAPAPKPDRKRLKDLFHAWEKSLDVQKDIENKLEEAKAKTSSCVKAILECGGPGPYGYHGAEYMAIRRGPTDKQPDAKEVFYFRVKGKEEELTQVD